MLGLISVSYSENGDDDSAPLSQ